MDQCLKGSSRDTESWNKRRCDCTAAHKPKRQLLLLSCHCGAKLSAKRCVGKKNLNKTQFKPILLMFHAAEKNRVRVPNHVLCLFLCVYVCAPHPSISSCYSPVISCNTHTRTQGYYFEGAEVIAVVKFFAGH